MLGRVEYLPCKERLRELGLCYLGQRGLQGELTAAPKCLRGVAEEAGI